MFYFTLTILIVAFCVDVFSLVKDVNKNFKKKRHKVILISVKVTVAFGLLYISIYQIRSQIRDSKINATFGEFGDQKDANISKPVLILGNSIFQNNASNNIILGGQPVNPVKIWEDNKQINVDIKINDSKGDGIASLNGRSWKIYNTNGIDYNNDDSAFEIITNEGRVIFQIV